MYQIPNAPQSIGGVLDSGFKLFRESLIQVFLLAAVTSLVTAPASYFAPYLQSLGPTPAVITGAIGGGLLIGIISLILTTTIVVRIDSIARGELPSVGDSLARGARRSPSALGSYLLMSLAIMAPPLLVALAGFAAGALNAAIAFAVVLCFVPGSIIAIWLIFGPYAAIIEGLGPLTSLRYSRAITRGNWWRTAGLITIMGIILLVLYIVLGLIASVVLITNPESLANGQPPWWIQFVLSPVLSAVGVPLSYCMLLAIFYDLKLRHEGGDLAARIAGTA